MSDILMQVRQDAGVVELAKQRVYTVEEIDAYDRALIAATRRAVLAEVRAFLDKDERPPLTQQALSSARQDLREWLATQLDGGDE